MKNVKLLLQKYEQSLLNYILFKLFEYHFRGGRYILFTNMFNRHKEMQNKI